MPQLTQSYVCGASTTAADRRHPSALISIRPWRGGGDREAIVMRHQNVRLTYAELKQRVDALAAGLIALGLAPGDRVGIWSPNKSEWIITQFATAKAGLIQVNLNPAYRLSEIAYAIKLRRLQSRDHRRALQVERLHRDAARTGARNRPRAAGPSRRPAPAVAENPDPHRRRRSARLL